MKNFSIITDFGCPFSCSFCVTKSQRTKKSFSFNESIFEKLIPLTKETERISISGGGEPLFLHNKEIEDFYKELFLFREKTGIPIHVHTNLNKPIEIAYLFDKVTISLNQENYKDKFQNWEDISHKRFVYVSDGLDSIFVQKLCEEKESEEKRTGKEIQLTIKQLESEDESCFDEVKIISEKYKGVMFLPTGDYNTYFYLNEEKVYNTFKEISFS